MAHDFPHRSSSRLHQSRDEDLTGKATPLSGKCASSVELQDVMVVCIGFAREVVWMMATRIGRKAIQRDRLWMEPHLRL